MVTWGEDTLVCEIFGKSSAQFLMMGWERQGGEGKAGVKADSKVPGLDEQSIGDVSWRGPRVWGRFLSKLKRQNWNLKLLLIKIRSVPQGEAEFAIPKYVFLRC